jgi:hypothetical protein
LFAASAAGFTLASLLCATATDIEQIAMIPNGPTPKPD